MKKITYYELLTRLKEGNNPPRLVIYDDTIYEWNPEANWYISRNEYLDCEVMNNENMQGQIENPCIGIFEPGDIEQ